MEDDTQKPLDQSELEKLPRKTLSKNMRDAEDILIDLAAGVELDESEERLADLLVFQKHGQHLEKFKNKKPRKEYDFPVIDADGNVTEPSKKKTTKKTVARKHEVKLSGDAPVASDIILKAADVIS